MDFLPNGLPFCVALRVCYKDFIPVRILAQDHYNVVAWNIFSKKRIDAVNFFQFRFFDFNGLAKGMAPIVIEHISEFS